MSKKEQLKQYIDDFILMYETRVKQLKAIDLNAPKIDYTHTLSVLTSHKVGHMYMEYYRESERAKDYEIHIRETETSKFFATGHIVTGTNKSELQKQYAGFYSGFYVKLVQVNN